MQGFNRNLTTAEIIAQVMIAKRYLSDKDRRISNVVFMGMGEPLLNEQAVYSACDLLLVLLIKMLISQPEQRYHLPHLTSHTQTKYGALAYLHLSNTKIGVFLMWYLWGWASPC
jgi:hypothetical protein